MCMVTNAKIYISSKPRSDSTVTRIFQRWTHNAHHEATKDAQMLHQGRAITALNAQSINS